MSLYILPENGHALRLGFHVPPDAVNIAYLQYPALGPEAFLAIVNSAESISGNEDDPAAGTRQIRVEGVVIHPSARWTVAVRPGSFYVPVTYVSEEVTASPTWLLGEMADAGQLLLDAGDTLTYLYTLTPRHTRVDSAAITPASSDPTPVVGGDASYGLTLDEPQLLADGTVQLPRAPIADAPISPKLYRYLNGTAEVWHGEDGTAFDYIPCTVVDAQRGIVRPLRPVNLGDQLLAAYIGTLVHYDYHGHWDAAGVHYAIDLNPMPGHFTASSLTFVQLLSNNAGAILTTEADEQLYLTMENASQLIDSRSLFAHAGMHLYLEPAAVIHRHYTDPETWDEYQYTNTRTPADERLFWVQSDQTGLPLPEWHCLLLARIFLRPTIALSQLTVHDTRPRGGGLADGEDAQDVADRWRYFDVAHLDGEPAMVAGAVVVRVSEAVWQAQGDAAIRDAVRRSLALGIAPIIETVP